MLGAVNVPVRFYLLLLHHLSKLISGMTVFTLNPHSNILGIRLLYGYGGCYDAVSKRIVSSWKEFRELLTILTNHAPNKTLRGCLQHVCKKSVFVW